MFAFMISEEMTNLDVIIFGMSIGGGYVFDCSLLFLAASFLFGLSVMIIN